MTILQRLRRQVNPQRATQARADIVLGLPLEVDDRAIYPVYLDPGSTPLDGGAKPRQIGYVEIGEGRADYTSLEPEYRWPVVFGAIAFACILTLWAFRRLSR